MKGNLGMTAGTLVMISVLIMMPLTTTNVFAGMHQGTSVGSSTIQQTCGLTVDTPTITYPPLVEDGATPTADQPVGLTKTGNAQNTVIAAQGTTWQVGGAGADIMPVGATAFANAAAVSHATKTPLTGADQELANGFTGTLTSQWSLLPDTLSGPQPGFAGVLQQTVTFTVTCP